MYDKKDVKDSDNTLYCLCFRLFIFIQAKKRVPVHNTKTYRGGKVQLSFLTSTLDGGK